MNINSEEYQAGFSAGLAARIPAGFWLAPLELSEAMSNAAAETPGIKALDAFAVLHQIRGYALPANALEDGSPLQQAYRAMRQAHITASEAPATAKETK
jgi:hypothetical protein